MNMWKPLRITLPAKGSCGNLLAELLSRVQETANLMARCNLHRCQWRFLRTARRGVLAAGVEPTARSSPTLRATTSRCTASSERTQSEGLGFLSVYDFEFHDNTAPATTLQPDIEAACSLESHFI